MEPVFFTIEGSDGAGKSTIVSAIRAHFRDQKLPLLCTREPGGPQLAEDIRALLLKNPQDPAQTMDPMTELLLYEAARSEHVKKTILPALSRGTHVLCDRFTHSTTAYQGYARGLSHALIRELNQAASHGLEPRLVIWLKVAPEEARRRLSGRPQESSRLDQEGASFHQKVFEGFTALAAQDPARFIVLDAERSPQEIFSQLLADPKWKRVFGGAPP